MRNSRSKHHRKISLPIHEGANRRAINLIPMPLITSDRELSRTTSLRYHQLLIRIEGGGHSCCLKVTSARRKSRSALLIYKGRVLGCIYGQRDVSKQELAFDAFKKVKMTLAEPGNMLDAYQLPDNLVLASASLFNGQILDFNSPDLSCQQVYQLVEKQIELLGSPGAIIITNESMEIHCITYFDDGKIIGEYSSQHGWQPGFHESALIMANLRGQAKVLGSVLAVKSIDDVLALGFSLTGIGDVKEDPWQRFKLTRRSESIQKNSFTVTDSWLNRPYPGISLPKRNNQQIPNRKSQHLHVISPLS